MTDTFEHLKAALADRYRVERALGSGGMATVYRARDLRHDRPVAIKVLRPELSATLGADRFLREIRIAAGLRHPHILPLYDSGEAEGLLYYVMPVEGESLRDRLRRDRSLPLEEALPLAREVLDALDYAHGEGVVHRDIKPENVLLSRGHAIIADFGIARAISAAGGERLTQAGLPIGTPAYMSPEQLVGDPRLDGRSDLYSVASVLCEMLTGELPIRGRMPESLDQCTEDQPSIAQAIRTALELDPAGRFASCDEFARALLTATVEVSPAVEQSIAVLPFTNMSTDPENEYFSDGITEEIINALAQLEDLRVAARTSSFAFKGKASHISEIGAKLNVATVLEGSVRTAGNRLRVSAQLVNVADGYHLWSERYDRQMDDVFAIQDEIATTIADRLKITLAGETKKGLVKPPTANLDAYQLYLKGRHLWNRRTKDALEQAVEYFEQATKLDPEYALAYSGLADAYLLLGSYDLMPREEADQKARAAAEKALELDEALAEAHTSLGQTLRRSWDWEGEEREYLRAIELNPNYATAHQWYATLLAALGRLDEALHEVHRAEELDPVSHAISATVAQVLAQAREYDAAIEQLHKTLELEPNFFSANAWLAFLQAERGNYSEAEQAAQKVIELRPDDPEVRLILAPLFVVSGQRDKALELLGPLKERGADPGAMGFLYTVLGEHDQAFEWLERAVTERSSSVFHLKVSPFLDPLRSDPRFDDLLRQMNFPE